MSNSTEADIDEILEQLDEDYDRNNYHAGLRTAKAKLQALLLRERIDELDHIDASQHTVTTAIGGDKVHIFDRMEELKQELEKL